jgi:hypothetical protein
MVLYFVFNRKKKPNGGLLGRPNSLSNGNGGNGETS